MFDIPLKTTGIIFPNTIQGIVATGKCIIENFNGTEWYSIVIVMNATVFPNTIRGRPYH